jgi:hypothetical protein
LVAKEDVVGYQARRIVEVVVGEPLERAPPPALPRLGHDEDASRPQSFHEPSYAVSRAGHSRCVQVLIAEEHAAVALLVVATSADHLAEVNARLWGQRSNRTALALLGRLLLPLALRFRCPCRDLGAQQAIVDAQLQSCRPPGVHQGKVEEVLRELKDPRSS